ncbi:MAG: hypothetical protein PHW50_03005, partial [Patescibacteria group bacterium]|nr:hypothetical protein [Patescibacteria group bacterium]
LGFGDYKKALNYLKKNKDYFIIQKEQIPYQKIPKFINQSKIIIGQLNVGALGMSELESMSSNKIVVSYANDCYYKNTIYKKYPPIVNVKSFKKLFMVLQKLFKNTNHLKNNSRIWVLKYHSRKSVVHFYLNQIYNYVQK